MTHLLPLLPSSTQHGFLTTTIVLTLSSNNNNIPLLLHFTVHVSPRHPGYSVIKMGGQSIPRWQKQKLKNGGKVSLTGARPSPLS